MSTDTIAAVATPPGRGGVGIVRVSGPAVPDIARRVLGCLPEPRRAWYGHFLGTDGEPVDDGIALYFAAPRSFTGEEVLELQGHGGPVVMELLMDSVCAAGARPARPGEFSQRAFLNGRLDLAQAEAVADLIDAGSRAAARAALRSLEGVFSRAVDELVEGLIALRVQVEAALDFPEEEIDFLADAALAAQLDEVRRRLQTVQHQAGQGRLLREGMTLVIAGRPNAGKSSLLNALAGTDAAIVTDIAGTTRDLLREHIQIDGMPLHVIDTAGLRESDDPVEAEGIRRAWQAIEQADLVLLQVDDQLGRGPEDEAILERLPQGLEVLEVHNKIDLSGHAPGEADGRIYLSARTGAGLEALRQALKQRMGYEGASGVFSARRRHLAALETAAEHLQQAAAHLAQRQGELLAEELRAAQQALEEITGRFTADDLLGRIFSSFCIGK